MSSRPDDAAHDVEVSSGTPDETATATADSGLANEESSADTVDGALSPGSTATSAPTDHS